ncbi:hypothetical protein SORBI_3008G041450 [Sorghum bicolor]|uniref:Uncharacterized protein n=1 Tax=Sorghum bicolor TaxID=4558 RepID=A0A1Z5R4Q2_SORBI|nr:hypothetical protein SORBI_3008G041450 [Sorghum bicolor]
MKLKSHITDSLEVAGVGAFNSVERLIPSLFKLEIQRYRLRVFPITATVKIGIVHYFWMIPRTGQEATQLNTNLAVNPTAASTTNRSSTISASCYDILVSTLFSGLPS